MKVIIDSDETGARLKRALATLLRGMGHDVTHCVPHRRETGYPDVAHGVAVAVASGQYTRGILICGTGLGVAMTANKARGAWAGTCSEPEQARRLVASNGGNILCIGCEIVSTHKAKKIAAAFVGAAFEGRPNAHRMRDLEAMQ